MKKIIITGGAGFIGTNLIKKLITKNYIYCIDDLSTSSITNIKTFMDSSNFEFIHQDITSPLNMNVDEIYHLACPASPIHYKIDPIRTIKTNFLGSLNILELANKNKSRIFHASTSEIYGEPLVNPQSEEYYGNVNTIGPRSCYDEGKRAAETLFFDFKRMHNIDLRVARIFNTYGPFMQTDDGRVVSTFINQSIKNEPITIFGDGNQTRSFCYIDDLIDGIISLMNVDTNEHGPINIGNPNETSINNLADQIIKLTNSKSNKIFKPLTENDPLLRQPDISKAKKILKFHPKVSLLDGLTKTISYYKKI